MVCFDVLKVADSIYKAPEYIMCAKGICRDSRVDDPAVWPSISLEQQTAVSEIAVFFVSTCTQPIALVDYRSICHCTATRDMEDTTFGRYLILPTLQHGAHCLIWGCMEMHGGLERSYVTHLGLHHIHERNRRSAVTYFYAYMNAFICCLSELHYVCLFPVAFDLLIESFVLSNEMVWLSTKKTASAAAAVGLLSLGISGGSASPLRDVAKRMNVALWGSNIGNLAATIKDFLKDTDAWVS